MESTAVATTSVEVNRRPVVFAGLLVLLFAVGSLIYYKWTGSYVAVSSVRATGAWTKTAESITTGGVLSATLNYFGRVWLALFFGILIGAAIRAAISPKVVVSLLGQGGAAKRQFLGGLAGSPLMLCSCCVTPIFTGVYQQGARLGAALSMMLASPGLNLAALVLTFLLFPLDLSLARLGAALAAVFVLPWVLERLIGGTVRRVKRQGSEEDEGPRSVGEFLVRFGKSLLYLSMITVPLIAAGVLLSSIVLPWGLSLTSGGTVLTILVVSAVSVLIALPTFFEIPLAILLIQMGAPGAAAAMLFAGPIANLPSFFVLARETNWRVSLGLALGLWGLAVVVGLAVSFR